MGARTSKDRKLVTLLALVATAAGCVHAPRPTSFETLGIPEPAHVEGRTAVILGWAREARAGWAIDRVRIDGRARPEWDPETQRPAVFYLRPGARVVKIYSRRGDAGDQLVRSRPAQIDAVADGVVLCTVRVEGAESPLPRLACQPRSPAPAPVASAPAAQPPAPAPAADQRVLERLQAIEDRLARLEELLRARLPEQGAPAPARPRGDEDPRRSPSIDTTPPW